ncbi:DUF6077 domain-containing protein [Micromonospora sp. WMMD1120]|uniref:DUF6077 domain-containing protein n=1 Tax=Micromonospora sp. WMMD1120 TaxID=3016106 RepID=UPI002415A3C9|nr:DUF6077 domain-containing protein [Micromonospora sp. WMMD1120]MDG4808996.1 DUF6077 domain-containing protein [Micromonospora sp. WMMD1120]
MTQVDDVVVAAAPADRDGVASGPRAGGGHGLIKRLNAGVAAAPVLVTDAAIVGFALWTLLYHLNLGLDLRPSVVFVVWLVLTPVAAYLWWTLNRRSRGRVRAGGAASAGTPTADAGWAPLLRRYALPVGAAVGAALLASLGKGTIAWTLGVLLGLVAIASAYTSYRFRDPAAGGPVSTDTTTPTQAYVVITAALAAAVYATFIGRVSLDDVFYVGKSVWVAERDEIPFREFLLTEGVLPAGSANPPLPSFEVFIGALARLLGVHAASATWYLLLPLLAVFAIFALWRLVQRWSPRRALLAFGVALAYILLVAGYPDALNTYHLPRLTQGKGVFVHALVPLAWVYLTDFLETRSRRALVLLTLLSVAAVGLTTTAVILLPLLAVAAVVMLVVARRFREAALCFAAASVYPLLSGALVRLLQGGLDETVKNYVEPPAPQAVYQLTMWLGLLGVIAGVAIWCSPLFLRAGVPRLLSAGAALVVTVALVPGVLTVGSNLTGLAAVLWRVPWIVPLPALVGMLAVIRLPRLAWPNRALAVGLPAALVLAFWTQGVPMWTADVVQTKPGWRMPETRKNVAFWIVKQDPQGPVLAPSSVMRALPQVTSRVRVVLARDLYLTDYGMQTQFAQDRMLLAKFADGTEPVSIPDVAAAMDRVDVGSVCVWRSNKVVADAAPTLRLERFASRKSPGGMVCYRRL